MRLVVVLASTLLVACRGDLSHTGEPDTGAYALPASGSVAVCPSRDVGEAVNFRGDFTGTVVEERTTVFTPLAQSACNGRNIDHAVTIEVEDGTRYAIGWRMYGPDGGDVTRALGLVPGETVGLHLDETCGEGCATSFSITRGDVLVGAVVNLGQPATPGLTVARGAEEGRYEEDCGTVAVHTLAFVGDTSLTLLPYATGELAIAGLPYTVMALDASSWVRETCTDLLDGLQWAAFADE